MQGLHTSYWAFYRQNWPACFEDKADSTCSLFIESSEWRESRSLWFLAGKRLDETHTYLKGETERVHWDAIE